MSLLLSLLFLIASNFEFERASVRRLCVIVSGVAINLGKVVRGKKQSCSPTISVSCRKLREAVLQIADKPVTTLTTQVRLQYSPLETFELEKFLFNAR